MMMDIRTCPNVAKSYEKGQMYYESSHRGNAKKIRM